MTTIVTRTETQTDGTAAKGSELTWSEVDTNFINLNDDKVEVSGAIVFAAKAGEALTKGDVVYVSGVSGNEPVVSKADADDASKMPAFGLAEADANLNAAVNVVTFGTLYDLDTSAFSAGDTVYVSTTAGGLTATKPAGESSLIQNLGLVIRSHASAGSIKVGGAGRTNAVPNLNDGNVFIGNASNQAETRALVEADISDLGSYIGLTDLSVATALPSGSGSLTYNNTNGTFLFTPANLSGYLTAESDTLDSVTDRGATTTNSITVGGLTVDTNTLVVDSTNNRVGIGLTAPLTALHVKGADPVLTIQDNAGTLAQVEWVDSSGNTLMNMRSGGTDFVTDLEAGGSYIYRNSGSEQFRIDSSGKLLVGTTSSTLQTSAVFEGPSAYAAALVAQSDSSANNWARIDLVNQNTTTNGIIYLDQSGNMTVRNDSVTGNAISLTAGNTADGNIIFNSKVGTERMRITSAGSVCIGDDDPDANGPRSALYVCSEDNNTGVSDNTNIPDIFVGASSTAGGGGAGGEIRFGSRVYGTSGFAAFKGYITDGTANYNLGHLDLNMRANNTSASMTRRFRFEYDGDFHADGDVVAYSTTVSDASLKDDVETIDSALDKVSSLRGVTYTWNAGSREGKRDLGVIAQEVEAVLPEIVREKEMPLLDGETYKTVDYEKLTAVLIEAVKELKAEVEALKNGASV